MHCHKPKNKSINTVTHIKTPYILSQTSKKHIMLYGNTHQNPIYTVTNIKSPYNVILLQT